MMTYLHCNQRLSLLLNSFYGEHFQSTRILINKTFKHTITCRERGEHQRYLVLSMTKTLANETARENCKKGDL